MASVLLVVILSILPQDSTPVIDNPVDYAVALRETQIYESLEIYPEIIGTAQPKDIFALVRPVEDQYGITWAMVELEDGTTGYFSDMVIVRLDRRVLEEVLAGVSAEELSTWNQEMVDSLRVGEIEAGMTRTQVLLARGAPLSESEVGGGLERLNYPRSIIVMKEGAVSAFTSVNRLPHDRNISLTYSAADEDFTRIGGRWEQRKASETVVSSVDLDGSGLLRVDVNPPVAGAYRFRGQWLAQTTFSSRVAFRVRKEGEVIGELRGDQMMRSMQSVDLGAIELPGEGTIEVEIESLDDEPFNLVALVVEYINMPLPELSAGDVLQEE